MSGINDCLLGLYEKALPAAMCWGDRLKTAKQVGYDFLEISIDETDERLSRLNWSDADYLELYMAMRENNLPILTMCLSANRRFPIGSEDEIIRKKGIQIIKGAVDFSIKTGVRIIQLAGYDEYYFERNDRTKALFFEAVQSVLEYAASRGVVLAFETLDIDLMESIEKTSKYVRETNSPFLQLYPDVGNISAMGKDIEKDFWFGEGRIVGIHLKDTLPGVFRDVPYDEGIVDFKSFFKLLKEMNYKGLLVAEMWATDDELASLAYAEAAYNYLIKQYRG